MRLALVFGVIGHLLRLFSLAFLPPLVLALADGELAVAEHFVVALIATAGVGWFFARSFPRELLLRRSGALAIVAGTWLGVGHFELDGCREVRSS